ncbi:class I glutamine amidotransferase-like protein [Epithele typhae]|uniref:class I glutamine amidotransferase-like protein n=1 Tax=Epithele typhae TaxID=378194 RepID=UPI002008AC56|nr:class I glutamine amidotransferase-like protein [Epithele typhae]KAH9912478.1 class I glutamine amidotransferase-like protein [Epithele typhae]
MTKRTGRASDEGVHRNTRNQHARHSRTSRRSLKGRRSSSSAYQGSSESDWVAARRAASHCPPASCRARAGQHGDACVALCDASPIESIHDVAAGGLSNALPELVHNSGLGAAFEIRDHVPDRDLELCPALGVGILVGKDSMSMSMRWQERDGARKEVSAPLSLIVAAFAAFEDVGKTWRPQLRTDVDGPTVLLFFDLARGKQRLGGSAVKQVFKQVGSEAPDAVEAQDIKRTQARSLRPASVTREETVKFSTSSGDVFSSTRAQLQPTWTETSYQMKSHRDNPDCSKEERPDLLPHQSLSLFRRPNVTILREQSVNEHIEMAWAFDAVDVHMSDILSGAVSLSSFRRLTACGGFSYGDVLGAARGWASSVLLNATARAAFSAFFDRARRHLHARGLQRLPAPCRARGVIPSAADRPAFRANRSERFEARVAVVEVVPGPDHTFAGARLPVAVAHGEGRAVFAREGQRAALEAGGLVAVRYTADGRVLALLPHTERVVTMESNSRYPPELAEVWKGVGPWFQLFRSGARKWCGK